MQSNLFGAAVPTKQAPSTPLTINLEEKISCAISREGVIETAELKGTLTVTPNTEAGQKVLIPISNLLKTNGPSAPTPKSTNLSTNPNPSCRPRIPKRDSPSHVPWESSAGPAPTPTSPPSPSIAGR